MTQPLFPQPAPGASASAIRQGLSARQLRGDELGQLWHIDRSERISGLYHVEAGKLVLRTVDIDLRGWPEGDAEKYQPEHEAAFARGAWFLGVFDGPRLVAATVVDNLPLGPEGVWRQLPFLHVSQALRGHHLGRWLLDQAKAQARRMGARALYASATPSVHTVDFYLRQGFSLAPTPDPRLFALDPEDIHLICPL